jgi:hypothetical protein
MPKTKFVFPLAIAAMLVIGQAELAAARTPAARESLDTSLSKATAAGRYFVELVPAASPIKVGSMQSWTVRVSGADHMPINNAVIKIGGGMPQHGHGLPTAPAVTKQLGPGQYLIEGVKFNMRGWWVFDVGVGGPAGSDNVRFNLVL